MEIDEKEVGAYAFFISFVLANAVIMTGVYFIARMIISHN